MYAIASQHCRSILPRFLIVNVCVYPLMCGSLPSTGEESPNTGCPAFRVKKNQLSLSSSDTGRAEE
jgi:hypothetical protein